LLLFIVKKLSLSLQKKKGGLVRKFGFAILILLLVYVAPSCNHNKIACPTYADSFPDAKKKRHKGKTGASGSTGPELPPVTKSRLSIMPPGYK
jgi:hypothetical protein